MRFRSAEKYFIQDKFDFYAPRTFGNGRTFYQISSWKDWVITYMEAMYILQEQYEKQEFNRLLAEENKIRDDAIRAKIVPVYQKFSQN